jgi:hypothetical protein
MRKRILALLVVLSLLVPMASAKDLIVYRDYYEILERAKWYGDLQDKYLASIKLVSDLNLMGANSTFDDSKIVTRAELMTILYTFKNGAPMEPYLQDLLRTIEPQFTDVIPADWHYPYIMWAYGAKITAGVGGGKMKPNGEVDYYQAMQTIINALGNVNEKSGITYDNKVALLSFAEDTFHISRAFEPLNAQAKLSRGELAVLLSFALDAHPILAYNADNTFTLEPRTHRQIYFWGR